MGTALPQPSFISKSIITFPVTTSQHSAYQYDCMHTHTRKFQCFWSDSMELTAAEHVWPITDNDSSSLALLKAVLFCRAYKTMPQCLCDSLAVRTAAPTQLLLTLLTYWQWLDRCGLRKYGSGNTSKGLLAYTGGTLSLANPWRHGKWPFSVLLLLLTSELYSLMTISCAYHVGRFSFCIFYICFNLQDLYQQGE